MTGEEGWPDYLVVKRNFEPYLLFSMGAAAVDSIDVWGRVGIGTRWLVGVEHMGGAGTKANYLSHRLHKI